MPYVKVDTHRVFYALRSAASRPHPDLVLVHGAGGGHQHWAGLVRWVGTATCYAVDLPGHGRTEGSGHRSIGAYAEFIVRFLDALHIDQAVVAGHSMGGATAMTVALGQPQRVAGLILVGTGARLRVLPSILDGALDSFVQTVDLICEHAYAELASPSLVQQGRKQMLQVDPLTLQGDLAACDAYNAMDSLGQIRAPTLVVCGTEDRLTPPKYSTHLANAIIGAELSTVAGAGHMVMLERPEPVAGAIGQALARWRSAE